ncbi:DUF3618 domain-containing protein [Actinoplanes palleronii]|uniref:DUF3618 domain-containing protein n=1 Tax=Actinoplanes palleronii TaxID=113570 RepID=A0ABQ4BBM9_9ACTN|nr:DUF3618 domain-containing protein [Actinoplanes palleronii]GIE68098.1 hypothetical protein Apa02nite_042060 [Actinoplanes palleronii]
MSTPSTDPERLTTEIKQTRADLGATVEALAAKTDVKARAKQAATDVTDRGREQLSAATTKVAEAAGTAATKVAEAAGTAREKLAGRSEDVKAAVAPMQRRARTLRVRAAEDPRVRRAIAPAAVAATVLLGALIVWVVRRRA